MLRVGRAAVGRALDVLDATSVTAVRSKEERDFVSNVDVGIERDVRRYLAECTPDVGFLGEEEGDSGPGGHVTWILDPIDGTSNFLHGVPLYGISLALVVDRRPVVGVIALPGMGSEYYAAAGRGAFKDGRPIRVRETEHLEESIVSIGDYATGHTAQQRNEPRLALTARLAAGVERVRMVGSAAVDMAWFAEGRTDAALSLSNSAWDFTAGAAIAREAGARVRDVDGSEHTLDSKSLVATAPGISAQMVDLVRAAVEDRRS